jgi:hypothetical protein
MRPAILRNNVGRVNGATTTNAVRELKALRSKTKEVLNSYSEFNRSLEMESQTELRDGVLPSGNGSQLTDAFATVASMANSYLIDNASQGVFRNYLELFYATALTDAFGPPNWNDDGTPVLTAQLTNQFNFDGQNDDGTIKIAPRMKPEESFSQISLTFTPGTSALAGKVSYLFIWNDQAPGLGYKFRIGTDIPIFTIRLINYSTETNAFNRFAFFQGHTSTGDASLHPTCRVTLRQQIRPIASGRFSALTQILNETSPTWKNIDPKTSWMSIPGLKKPDHTLLYPGSMYQVIDKQISKVKDIIDTAKRLSIKLPWFEDIMSPVNEWPFDSTDIRSLLSTLLGNMCGSVVDMGLATSVATPEVYNNDLSLSASTSTTSGDVV